MIYAKLWLMHLRLKGLMDTIRSYTLHVSVLSHRAGIQILLCRITKSPSFYVYLGPDVMRLGEGRVWSKDLILGFGQGVRSLLVLLKDPYPTVHRELPSSSHLTQKLKKISSNYTHVHPLITAYRTWYIYANPPSPPPPQVHSVAVCFIDIWSINSLTKKFNCDGFT